MNEPTYLTSVDIARICRTSPETVRYWRHIGKGPASFKLGRKVLYAAEDVEAWLTSERRAGNDHKAARQEAGPERVGGEGSARTEELGVGCHAVADERQQVLGTCLPAADPVPTDLINLVLAFQQIQEKAITSVEKLRIQDCIDAARRIYRGGQ